MYNLIKKDSEGESYEDQGDYRTCRLHDKAR